MDAAPLEPGQDFVFNRAGMKQVNRMHAPALANAIDAADALFQPLRIPRQLDRHDQPAAMMQVQAFAAGVGRD